MRSEELALDMRRFAPNEWARICLPRKERVESEEWRVELNARQLKHPFEQRMPLLTIDYFCPCSFFKNLINSGKTLIKIPYKNGLSGKS